MFVTSKKGKYKSIRNIFVTSKESRTIKHAHKAL